MKDEIKSKVRAQNQNEPSDWNKILEKYGDANLKQIQMDKFIARIKCNENFIENFPQLVILAILIQIIRSPTTQINVLKTILDPNALLYLTTILSLSTVIRAAIAREKAQNQGCLPFKGLILFGLYVRHKHHRQIHRGFPVFHPVIGIIARFMALEVRSNTC